MPRNGSGSYSLVSGQPVVTGTVISSSVHNALAADIAAELTNSLDKDGQTVVTGDIDFNGLALILDPTGNTKIQAGTDNILVITINNAADFELRANILRALSGSVIETNTINETTSGSGVTIDGVLVKDGGVNGTLGATTPAAVAGTTGAFSGNVNAGGALPASNYSGANVRIASVGAAENEIGTVIAKSFGSTHATQIEMYAGDGLDQAGLYVGGTTTSLGLGVNGSIRAVIDTSGHLILPAGITLGAASYFDSQTLDDYEEGSWTPAQGSGVTVTGAYVSAGRYVKVGKLVFLSLQISGATNIAVTAAGQLFTSASLPFLVGGGLSVDGVGSLTTGAANTSNGFSVAANCFCFEAISTTAAALHGSACYRTT